MAAPIVYEGVSDLVQLEGVGQLFADKKFWVAQRVPHRNRLLDDIKANGGEIVMLEKKADYLIADHYRKDCPPGSISYEFVEKSIRDGRLRDPEDHRAGPRLGEAREPGALNRPTKSSRAPFTAEEDTILYKWVRDFEKQGGAISGNEIYKQLEAKYPRHTFQSWRDRYLRHLRHRPASSFNAPGNAPPSPPPDDSTERISRPRSSSNRAQIPAPKKSQPQKNDAASNIGKSRKKLEAEQDYTLEQLAATFTSDDWEELYAFVDMIEESAQDEVNYAASWDRWATSQDNQTAEQWRQYYEKVVRPQWRRDPEWKRKQIREKIEKKYEERTSQSQNASEQQGDTADADEQLNSKETGLGEEKAQELEEIRSEQKGSFAKGIQPQPSEPVPPEAEAKAMSSSTTQYQSPSYISAVYQNAMKRVREFTNKSIPSEDPESSRPSKRQRSTTPQQHNKELNQGVLGTQEQPLEIISSQSSTKTPQLEIHESASPESVSNANKPDAVGPLVQGLGYVLPVDPELEILESMEPSDQELPLEPDIEVSESDLPSNTPTPRGPRHNTSIFDTQAIPSSPLGDSQINKVPPPSTFPDDTQRSSSLAPHPESEASTTHSLEEFRRSLNERDRPKPYQPDNLPARNPSFSPAPSSTSIAFDEDPDPPLDASELNAYFDEKLSEGFPNEYIVKALKRTRFRPDLTDHVLEAWAAGQPLPNERGIWSLEEDEAVENGDGTVIAQLAEKHTLDGWGGVTERSRFLEGYRSR